MGAPRQLTINSQEVDLEKAVADALEKILAPVAETICEMERIRRKEYLTEKEVEKLFSLSAATLKTQRSRGAGPKYIKQGTRVFYSRKDVVSYLERQKGQVLAGTSQAQHVAFNPTID